MDGTKKKKPKAIICISENQTLTQTQTTTHRTQEHAEESTRRDTRKIIDAGRTQDNHARRIKHKSQHIIRISENTDSNMQNRANIGERCPAMEEQRRRCSKHEAQKRTRRRNNDRRN